MDEYLTVNETIQQMKVSRATLYRMVEQGKLTIYKVGGGKKTFFNKQELKSLFAPGEYQVTRNPKMNGRELLNPAAA